MEVLKEITNKAIAALTTQPITIRRFRLPLDADTAYNLLEAAYTAEVRKRGSDIAPDNATESNLRKVSRWLTEGAKPSLILFGGVGNGKSTMARSILSSISSLRKMAEDTLQTDLWRLSKEDQAQMRRLSSLPIVDFVTAQDVANLASNDTSKFESICKSGFLIIDDLGCEPRSVKNFGTEITPVIELLYRRYDSMMPTVVTSNLGKNDIREYYGERIADRFNEIFDRLFYSSTSYRSVQ